MKLTEPIVFVRLKFGLPSQTRKVDSKATAEAQNIDPKRLSASAKLFAASAFMKIKTADAVTRGRLTNLAIQIPNTPFRGSYVVPRKLLEKCSEQLDAAAAERNDLVIDFLAESYDGERDRAKQELGDAFSDADYPPADQLQKEFSMSWSYFSLDVPEDLPAAIRERETAKLQAEVSAVACECRQALRQGLADLVGCLVDKLSPSADGKTKRLYTSSVVQLREFLDTVSSRDITSDEEIRKLSEQARAIIGTASADDIRDNAAVAARIRDGLAAVNTAVQGLVKVDGVRAIDLSEDD